MNGDKRILDLKFLKDLDEFVNQFDLYVDRIYNQAQLSLDEDYFSKLEQRTTITLKRGGINDRINT